MSDNHSNLGSVEQREDRLLKALQQDTCPDCGADGLLPGPRGGAGQNLFCDACGSAFNVALPRYIITAQRIPSRKTDA
jgi:hypothetical protein